MKIAFPLLLGMTLTLAGSLQASQDFDPARFLQEKCSACHTDTVYSRPDHRMHNRQQLEAQVRRCDANVGTRLFDEDITALVDYLDRRYYHFTQQ